MISQHDIQTWSIIALLLILITIVFGVVIIHYVYVFVQWMWRDVIKREWTK